MMRLLSLLSICVLISGCASFSGGATYRYTFTSANSTTEIKVDSNREVQDGLVFHVDPKTGAVDVQTGGLGNGPNNTEVFLKALIQALIETAKAVK